MKIVGFLMCYNESSRGNLTRCLDNLSIYCDDIVVYDDGSTDDSLDVIKTYTEHVIASPDNDFMNEVAHRQQLLSLALTLKPDYVFWLDADEVLDSFGTEGGLRSIAHSGFSYEFEEITLWRSRTWRRLDYLGQGWFKRLWKTHHHNPLTIPAAHGLHRQLYPDGLTWARAPYSVIHYGYSTQEAIERRWRERTNLGLPKEPRRKSIDESNLQLKLVPLGYFPSHCRPLAFDEKPEPITYGVS